MDFAPFAFAVLRSILEFMDIIGGTTKFIDSAVAEVGAGTLGTGFFDLLFGQDFAFSGFNFGFYDEANNGDGTFTGPFSGFLARLF